MKEEAFIMGMPILIEIVDNGAEKSDISEVFEYFHSVDRQFSTYKTDSEVMKINRGELDQRDYSPEMKKILGLSEETQKLTNGYFNIMHKGFMDPSGIVKGYAIWNGAKLLLEKGYKNFFVEIAGDIQTHGLNSNGTPWKVGIENPFNRKEIIKVVELSGEGIATSGNYIRGKHIYNPHSGKATDEIASITVIGENVYEADRFATAAFAAGEEGLELILKYKNLAGFMVKKNSMALKTPNFQKYEVN